MKLFAKVILAGGVIVLLLQFVRPAIPTLPATADVQAPSDVERVLEKDCYSCHSNQRHLAWFDQIVPAYWLVRNDILTARQHLDFSTLGEKPPAAQKAALYEAVNMMQLGHTCRCPTLLRFIPDARVAPGELMAIQIPFSPPWSTPVALSLAAPGDNPTRCAGFHSRPFSPNSPMVSPLIPDSLKPGSSLSIHSTKRRQ